MRPQNGHEHRTEEQDLRASACIRKTAAIIIHCLVTPLLRPVLGENDFPTALQGPRNLLNHMTQDSEKNTLKNV